MLDPITFRVHESIILKMVKMLKKERKYKNCKEIL